MSENNLSIFLASPLELSKERVLIGSRIGLLNTYYYQQDKYISLNKWEDFSSSYIGIRTQSAYNEYLLKPSEVVIVLFHKHVGHFTKEECEKAVSLNKRIFVALKANEAFEMDLPSDVLDYVGYIESQPTYEDTWLFSSSDDLLNRVNDLIEDRLGRCSNSIEGIEEHYSCYIAHTDLLNFGADELRDKIRARDMRTREYGKRILLLPSKCTSMISQSKYNCCMYLEEPNEEIYHEARLMYEKADSNGVPLIRCKFYYEGHYVDLPFDNICPSDFGKSIPLPKREDDSVRLDVLCDGILDEIVSFQTKHYSKLSSKVHFDIKSGKFTLNGMPIDVDDSVIALIDSDKIRNYKIAEERMP